MNYVDLLQSIVGSDRHHVGVTTDTVRRLFEHNNGKSIHTNKRRPWTLVVTVGVADTAKAVAFERCQKSGSGRAFAKKHF
jgi:putative endonuclease